MFGLAIWDDRRKKLVLARDAAGIKLVYYRVDGGTVVFGSELRAVLAALAAAPGRRRDGAEPVPALSLHAVAAHAVRRACASSRPARWRVVENGDWRVERWYQHRPQRLRRPLPDAEATEELLDIYKRALKRHLISDVPVGLLLRGGVDSGLLLGLMNLYGKRLAHLHGRLRQAAYKDDELTDAAETARPLRSPGTRRSSSAATPSSARCRGSSPILEEPIAASSIVPMYFVCERARQDVKVALVGQGPDELFGGYKRHLGVQYGRALAATARLAPRAASRPASAACRATRR